MSKRNYWAMRRAVEIPFPLGIPVVKAIVVKSVKGGESLRCKEFHNWSVNYRKELIGCYDSPRIEDNVIYQLSIFKRVGTTWRQ